MKKKKILGAIALILIGIVSNVLILTMNSSFVQSNMDIQVTMRTDVSSKYQMFYWQNQNMDGVTFQESMSVVEEVEASETFSTYIFTVPSNTRYIRFDLGEETADIEIQNVAISYKNKTVDISTEQLEEYMDSSQVKTENGEEYKITATGNDPYLVWSADAWNINDVIANGFNTADILLKVLICLIIDAILLVMLRQSEKLISIPLDIYRNRKLISNLSRNDFKTRYAGSYLGIFWAFVQPVVTILVYWFVFEKGLKAGGATLASGQTVPFVLFLVSGIVPWFFFSDALNGGTGAMVGYSFLVKKVVFQISILPIVKVMAALYVHLFFVVFALCLFAGYGYMPDLYTLQIVYYTFALLIFVLGLCYLTCSIVVFFKDLSEIINIILQIGVWITPVMWNLDSTIHSPALKLVFELNPLYYIVSGYRDALINKVWFWEHPGLTIYYWIVTFAVGGVGMLVFRKLKVHFADVL